MRSYDAYWYSTSYAEARRIAAWAGIQDDYVVERTVEGCSVYSIVDRETGVPLTVAQVEALRPGVWSAPAWELLAGDAMDRRGGVLRVRAVDETLVRVAVAYDNVADPAADVAINKEQALALYEWLGAWLSSHGKEIDDA